MRFAILGDIHSNLEAFNAVLEDLDKIGVDKIFCIGDIVGYGADPIECINVARERFESAVIGNYDLAAIGRLGLDGFDDAAAKALVWTQGMLGADEKDFLSELPLIDVYQDMVFTHSNLYDPDGFYYIENKAQIMRNFDFQEDKTICFIGHSHVPFIALSDNIIGEAFLCKSEEIYIEQSKRYLVDVGSVGQPRDGDPRATYVVYDQDKSTLRIERVDYDIDKASTKIALAGLPAELGMRLFQGV